MHNLDIISFSSTMICSNSDSLDSLMPAWNHVKQRATTLHSEVASYDFLLLLGESGSHNYQIKLSQTAVTQRGKMKPPKKFIFKAKLLVAESGKSGFLTSRLKTIS